MLWRLERYRSESGEMSAIIVRANCSDAARVLAAQQCGDEGIGPWLDPVFTICEAIPYDGPPEVILRQIRG